MRITVGTSVKGALVAIAALALSWGFCEVRAQNSSRQDFSAHLSLLGFNLEKSTLADVGKELGASNPGGCSSEVEAEKIVCYVSDGPNKTRVLFQSGFSGGWSILDGFKVTSLGLPAACHLRCKVTDKVVRDVRTPGGLRLGLAREDLVALLGDPTETKGDKLTFQRTSKRPMTSDEIARTKKTSDVSVESPYYDVQDTIVVVIGDSKVVEFEVQRIVTY